MEFSYLKIERQNKIIGKTKRKTEREIETLSKKVIDEFLCDFITKIHEQQGGKEKCSPWFI